MKKNPFDKHFETYRGHRYSLQAIAEDPEQRIARGDWRFPSRNAARTRIVGWRVCLYTPTSRYCPISKAHRWGFRKMRGFKEFETYIEAESYAEGAIDAIADSL